MASDKAEDEKDKRDSSTCDNDAHPSKADAEITPIQEKIGESRDTLQRRAARHKRRSGGTS